eukprot:gene1880-12598_t
MTLGMLVLDEVSLCPLLMIDQLASVFADRLVTEGFGDSNAPNRHAMFPFALVPLIIMMGDPMQRSPSSTQGISLYEWRKMFRTHPPHPQCPAKLNKQVFGDLRHAQKCKVCGTGSSTLDECFESREKQLNDWPDDEELVPPKRPALGDEPIGEDASELIYHQKGTQAHLVEHEHAQ